MQLAKAKRAAFHTMLSNLSQPFPIELDALFDVRGGKIWRACFQPF